MMPNIRTNFCPNCEAQANTIEELRAANERWVIAFNQAKADATGRIETLQADNARLREALFPFAELWALEFNMNDPISMWFTVAPFVEAVDALQETGQ